MEIDIEDAIPDSTLASNIRAIRQMKRNGGAPVDTMGCHMLGDRDADPKVQRVVGYFD